MSLDSSRDTPKIFGRHIPGRPLSDCSKTYLQKAHIVIVRFEVLLQTCRDAVPLFVAGEALINGPVAVVRADVQDERVHVFAHLSTAFHTADLLKWNILTFTVVKCCTISMECCNLWTNFAKISFWQFPRIRFSG